MFLEDTPESGAGGSIGDVGLSSGIGSGAITPTQFATSFPYNDGQSRDNLKIDSLT